VIVNMLRLEMPLKVLQRTHVRHEANEMPKQDGTCSCLGRPPGKAIQEKRPDEVVTA
jgi:hypothetical protein